MDELTTRNNKVLELLIKENLITENQLSRIRIALECGMMMLEAMEKIPLVDPIKLAGIQTIAERSPKETPQPQEPHPPSLDDAKVLELDEMDANPIELDSGSFKIENLGPVGANAEKIPPCKPDNDTPVKKTPTEKNEISSMVFEIRGKLETTADVLEERIKKRKKEQAPMDWQGKDGVPYTEKIQKTDAEPFAIDPSMDEVEIPKEFHDEIPSTEKLIDFNLDLDLDFDFDEPIEEPTQKSISGLNIPPLMQEKTAISSEEEEEHEKQRFAKDLVDAVGKQGLNTEYREEIARAMSSVLDDAFNDSLDNSLHGKDDDDSERLPPLGSMDGYKNPTTTVGVFDLSDDEGIAIIAEVNQFLGDCLEKGEGGFILSPKEEEENLKYFSKIPKLVAVDTVEKTKLEKVLNRLKVMARLESWRSNESQKGLFKTKQDSSETAIYMDAEKDDDGGRIIVHFHRQNKE